MDNVAQISAGNPTRVAQFSVGINNLGDVTMASTILDHLMHRCAMLEFEGKSYRVKVTATRIAPVSS